MDVIKRHCISRCINAVWALVLILTLSSCAALVRPNFETEILKLRKGQYTLDQRHSFVIFKVSHLGLSTYLGRFNRFGAELDFDPDDLPATSLEGAVEMGSVDTGDAEVDSLLNERAWFDTAGFPQATFVTTEVRPVSDGEIAIGGSLTLRGITRDIELTGRFNGGADNLLTRRYTLGFSAIGQFSRSDFGIDSFSGLVGDEVTIEVYAEFLRN